MKVMYGNRDDGKNASCEICEERPTYLHTLTAPTSSLLVVCAPETRGVYGTRRRPLVAQRVYTNKQTLIQTPLKLVLFS